MSLRRSPGPGLRGTPAEKDRDVTAADPVGSGRFVSPDPADGRGVVVRYTPRGLAALQVARTRRNELERRFASHIGADRWRTVRDVLEALFYAEGTSQPHG
jgi:hypothetical protein